MKQRKNPPALKPLVIATLMTLGAGNAAAIEFEVGDGWKGNWNTTLSYGAAWRMEDQNTGLYSLADGNRRGLSGGKGGSNNDAGNLNWDNGDQVQSVFKFVTDLSIAKGGFGGLVRVKGWTDLELENGTQKFGNQGQRPYYNGAQPGGVLSDSGLEMMSRYTGIKLMDAYVYGTFDIGERPLQLKVGNQVVNWGESVFLQGINYTSPLDLPALRRGAGTEIKEFLIPVGMVFANLGLPGGASLEGFWQYDWQRTVIDSCGTYFSPAENSLNSQVGNCNIATSFGGLANADAAKFGQNVGLVEGKDPDSNKQFGVALRFPVEALDTEFGMYYQQLHSRTPIISVKTGQAVPGPFIFAPNANYTIVSTGAKPYAGLPALQGFWEYPEDLKIFAVTAATTLGGWSVGSELSYTKDVPVQINGNDIVAGFLQGVGPQGLRARTLAGRVAGSTAVAPGTIAHGYDLFDKTSFQVNGVKLFSDVLGAQIFTVIGEVGFQWNNLPDNNGVNARYGRGFVFGNGAHSTLGPASCFAGNPQPDGCKNDGYFTDYAMGTRLRGALTYNNVFDTGITATPSVFWARDWTGYSIDSQFSAGRNTWAFGLKLDYNKQYALDLAYTMFADSADFDLTKDRDFLSLGLSVTF